MIVVKLYGGLGNQMFQYALGRQLSILQNTPLKYDDGFFRFENDPSSTRREVELGVFHTKFSKASREELDSFLKKGTIQKRLEGWFPFLESHRVIHETSHLFNEKVMKAGPNTYLDGYWQSEYYFSNCRAELLQDFTLKEPPGAEGKVIEQRCRSKQAVSLHIRRGDYVSNAANTEYHGICSLDYYYEAIRLIGDKMQTQPELMVFSDDMPWVKEHFKPGIPFYGVEDYSGKKSAHDLYFMSLCRHNIVANSSFSWWGAWLNTHRDKLVVAPRQWYATKTIDSSKIAPDNWIRL